MARQCLSQQPDAFGIPVAQQEIVSAGCYSGSRLVEVVNKNRQRHSETGQPAQV
jgi:hypothetical protein